MKRVLECNLVFAAAIILLFLTTSCRKHEVPVLTTADVTSITATAATSGGTITSDGNRDVTSRGVCWGSAQNPTISGSKTTNGTGAGSFVSNITGLTGGSIYHVRAYATNSEGTAYGADKTFTTLGQAPVATTLAATDLLTTSATLNGTVNANYLSTTVTFEYGLTTGYGSTATATQSPVTGSTAAGVSVNVTGLAPGTLYHFRVKTVNSLGTTNGNDLSFTTLGQAPAAVTVAASNLLSATATLNGTVNANYLSTVVTFEYGLTTSYGSTATATQSPVTGSTSTSVSANIASLTPGTLYHFRVKGVNTLGTTNGSDMTFTTQGLAPVATTLAATNVQALTATLNGTVNAGYISTVVTFEYGLTTNYGSTATASQSPVSGSSTTNVSANLTSLTPGAITYHYRVKAVNASGTTYGSDMTFTTLGDVPIARTSLETNVTSTTATLTGIVVANDLSTTVTFEYGLTDTYGLTISAVPGIVTGSDNTDVSANISGLLPGTVYHFRVKAVNALGTSYGEDFTFTTSAK